MNHLQDQAIIISCRDYRENDRLVRLFTLEHGPLTALARGAKRSKKRFCGSLEPFSSAAVELSIHDSSLSILHGVGNNSLLPALRQNLDRFGQAGYACELVDRFLPEHLPNPRLFRLLTTYLHHLGTDGEVQLNFGRRFFEINLLNILGYRPDLASHLGSGLLSQATAANLQSCLTTSRISSIHFAPDDLREAGQLLDRALARHLDRPLKSLDFLEEISHLQND